MGFLTSKLIVGPKANRLDNNNLSRPFSCQILPLPGTFDYIPNNCTLNCSKSINIENFTTFPLKDLSLQFATLHPQSSVFFPPWLNPNSRIHRLPTTPNSHLWDLSIPSLSSFSKMSSNLWRRRVELAYAYHYLKLFLVLLLQSEWVDRQYQNTLTHTE